MEGLQKLLRIGPEKLHRGPDEFRRRAMYSRANKEVGPSSEEDRRNLTPLVSETEQGSLKDIKLEDSKDVHDWEPFVSLINKERDANYKVLKNLCDEWNITQKAFANDYIRIIYQIRTNNDENMKRAFETIVKKYVADKISLQKNMKLLDIRYKKEEKEICKILNDKYFTYDNKKRKIDDIRTESVSILRNYGFQLIDNMQRYTKAFEAIENRPSS
jgi:hypothetical protein